MGSAKPCLSAGTATSVTAACRIPPAAHDAHVRPSPHPHHAVCVLHRNTEPCMSLLGRTYLEACGTKGPPAACVAASCGLLLLLPAELERRSYAPRPRTPALYVKKPSSMGSSCRCTAALPWSTVFHLRAALQDHLPALPQGCIQASIRIPLYKSMLQPSCRQRPVRSSGLTWTRAKRGHGSRAIEAHSSPAPLHTALTGMGKVVMVLAGLL